MPKTIVEYWLALKFIPRLAVHKKLQLVKSYGLKELFQSSSSLTSLNLTPPQTTAILDPQWDKITAVINASIACGSQIIVYTDPRYPGLLKQIYDPPLVLFVRGNSEILNHKQLAIVGSRYASISGRESSSNFASELVRHDFVITSGLALGIDAAAHRGALQANGGTIAVVATGVDKIYPARHKQLVNDIIASGGAIISEFITGTPPKAGHFPKRNRIISGLSQGVLVVEAALASGSLITARCALEQGREVYAVPGAIANPLVKGCHWLIKQGAKLVDETADIITELNMSEKEHKQAKKPKNNCQQDLFNDALLASVGYEVTPVDIVVSRSKLPIEEALTRLTMLELKGLISAVPGGYILLKRG